MNKAEHLALAALVIGGVGAYNPKYTGLCAIAIVLATLVVWIAVEAGGKHK